MQSPEDLALDQVPLVVGVLWLAVVFLPDSRALAKVLAGKCFVAINIGLCVTQLIYWIVLNDLGDTLFLDTLGVSSLILTTCFFYLYCKWSHAHRHVVDIAAPLGAVFTLALLWNSPATVQSPPGSDDFVVSRPPEILFIVGVYFLTFLGLSFLLLYLGVLRLRTHDPSGARHLALFYTLIALTSLGNVLASASVPVQSPFFKTLPSVFELGSATTTFYVLSRGRARDFLGLLVSMHKGEAEVLGAYLVHNSGLLVASQTLPSATPLDRDILMGTLDILSHSLQGALGAGRGSWLSSVEQGDLTLLLERGRHCYLVLQIRGRAGDMTRLRMRHALASFERLNREALSHWKGLEISALRGQPVVREFVAPSGAEAVNA